MDMDCYVTHLANYYLVLLTGLIANVAFLTIWAFPLCSTVKFR